MVEADKKDFTKKVHDLREAHFTDRKEFKTKHPVSGDGLNVDYLVEYLEARALAVSDAGREFPLIQSVETHLSSCDICYRYYESSKKFFESLD